MPALSLTTFSLNAALQFAQSRTVTGFGPLSIGPITSSFGLSGLDLTVWDKIYAAIYTIAPSGSQTLDFMNFTDLDNNTGQSFGHVLCMFILPTDGECFITSVAINGLVWFLHTYGDAVIIKDGGILLQSLPSTSAGQVVDATHRYMSLGNLGTTTTSVLFYVVGSSA